LVIEQALQVLYKGVLRGAEGGSCPAPLMADKFVSKKNSFFGKKFAFFGKKWQSPLPLEN